MSDPPFNPFNKSLDIYKGKLEPSEPTESTLSDYNTDLDKKNTRQRIRLDQIPIKEARTQVAADIYVSKLEHTIKIYQKMVQDVRERGYFPPDKKEQQELILGAEAWNQYLDPLYSDKFSVDWVASFDPIAREYLHDNHFTELPEFARKVRWQIYSNGDIENLYPHTKENILGGSIIHRINKIMMISDCIPFMTKVWENNRKTRYMQQLKRNTKKFNKRELAASNTNPLGSKKKEREIDPLDYDISTDLHNDPIRNPPTPVSVKDLEEYDTIPEAYFYGFMRKDKPNDLSEFWKAYKSYCDLKY